MIALPGRRLERGRLNDSKKILQAFANSTSEGMLPNRFQDRGLEPEYNNADGTLWYFIAIHQYLLAGGDKKFVFKELLPVLTGIIDWHYKGTRYHIHVSEDHLLFAGEPGVQLTWMDAKVNDWVVTPRIGKAVEINALWYNALRIYAGLLKLSSEKKEAKHFRNKAKQTKKQFVKLFWNDELNYLYDVVNDDHNDSSLRPNQLFALGLPYPLVKGRKAKLVLKAVQEHLVTPFGLRSLSPDDAGYSGMYEGNIVQRDGAYHQGTVWSWLTGIYIDVLFKIHGKSAKDEALNSIQQLIQHLNEAGIGSVSEIFDGDAPHLPRGCIAQAWSVAELLRVIHQYDLFSTGSAK
ncbi:MAG TPA: amylo-alpha-1,6-glucosidase [Chitinophagales bacterium]|nr:amylo-alpha-1,6-glucosidase [Chitinophagales bacterium]